MENGFGYSGKILRVDLSTGSISHVPTSAYADRFVGGRGVAAKIYWDLVPADVGAFEPENCLIIATGPLTGFAGLSSSRWQVCTKSPITNPERFCYCSLGGQWGAQLKFAGYDGLIVQGASEKPVYLSIGNDEVEIRDASHLWQRTAIEAREAIKGEFGRDVRVVSTGPAGDNLVRYASLLADNDASGSSGAGAVMGSKKLKAIAVRGTGKVRAADPERLRGLVEHVRELKRVRPEELERIAPKGSNRRREACFGCIGSNSCSRVVMQAGDGTRGKYMCNSSFYEWYASRHYGGQTEVPFFAARLCDAYGIDNMVAVTTIMWLNRCFRAGILDEENTGLPLSKLGSLEFIETLVKKIALREGFGDTLAEGPIRAAEIVGGQAPELVTDYVSGTEQPTAYGPRMYVTTALLHAMEPRQPIQQLHEISFPLVRWVKWHNWEKDSYMTGELFRRIGEEFWGSEQAADLSTYEGKALAAKKIQDRQYAKESLILCDFSWPITFADCTEDHMGDPTLESQVFSAATGRETDEEGLYRIGERVFNLQRAVLAREGRLGREFDRLKEAYFTTPLRAEYSNPDCWAPGKDGEPFQKRGWTVDREEFEDLKTEYYQLRGWDSITGLQTTAQLHDLGLEEIAAELAKLGAAV